MKEIINIEPLSENELCNVNGGSEFSESIFRFAGWLYQSFLDTPMQTDSIHAK